jgi:hypothetical protein
MATTSQEQTQAHAVALGVVHMIEQGTDEVLCRLCESALLTNAQELLDCTCTRCTEYLEEEEALQAQERLTRYKVFCRHSRPAA